MVNYPEIALSVIFFCLGLYLAIGDFRTLGKAKYLDRFWTMSRILFLICAVFVLLSIFIDQTIYTRIRLICMLFCIIAFICSRDGIGDEGVTFMGKITPWDKVKNYDHYMRNNKYTLVLIMDNKERFIFFDPRQKEEIENYLKQTVGKKYLRMKKI